MTTKAPVVTVVITSFNREKYLAASIESVLASRFSDFQLLVVDDSSTDGSWNVARAFAEQDPRVRVVLNEKNLGDYSNRNRAIELVTTPFLKYHDSDDIMYPHCLEVMVPLLLAEPGAGFALSHGKGWPGGPCPMLLTPRMAYQREYLGSGLFFCGPAGALFRTEVLRNLGGFPDCGVASDYCFWMKACASTNVLLVPADLFWYRRHAGQEMSSPAASRDYALAEARAWRTLFAADCPLTEDERKHARRNFARRMLKLTLRDLRNGRWSTLRLRLRESGFGLRDLLRYFPGSSGDSGYGTPRDDRDEVVVPDWVRSGGRPAS
jgi:glycosyltransferase involved in cell wall biosynthesis